MSRTSIAKAARSLLYRQKLSIGIPELEAFLRGKMDERNTTSTLVPGFRITVDNHQLSIHPVSNVSPGQLVLPIEEEELDDYQD